MAKAYCCFLFLLTVAVIFVSSLESHLNIAKSDDDNTNIVIVDEDFVTEVKESNLKSKCYDVNTKTFHKIDSVWYPENKCEKHMCIRLRDTKTPTIKIMECETCAQCDSFNQECKLLKPSKQYPKCCPKCMPKDSLITKKNKLYKPKQIIK
ncbi:uncharacterized protein LOC126906319 [Daktulosphaira vitifoliae]|uniref:uncharacterized protein LOC126906319 n=1 Tax=Daktulosphaira vitifoliae TaxID=58002 RepID=UPI0021AB08F7|nr:uncharacterized protein LOC126906319 [Daktulosphaira vitifoliae]